ncbi:MAG: hypothetical protein QOG72_1757 [Sphingomonadales bacterium]|jgi:hypothetical protein|nr:hypothetical protein [Sphingomonadales bacterium]
MKKWYWIAIAIWCVTGLPVLLLGIGFAGGIPSWPTADTTLPWMLAWLLIFAPLILFPFGRKV